MFCIFQFVVQYFVFFKRVYFENIGFLAPMQFWKSNISKWKTCDFKNSDRKSLARPYVCNVVLQIYRFPNFCLRTCVFGWHTGIFFGKSLMCAYVFDIVCLILCFLNFGFWLVFVFEFLFSFVCLVLRCRNYSGCVLCFFVVFKCCWQ